MVRSTVSIISPFPQISVQLCKSPSYIMTSGRTDYIKECRRRFISTLFCGNIFTALCLLGATIKTFLFQIYLISVFSTTYSTYAGVYHYSVLLFPLLTDDKSAFGAKFDILPFFLNLDSSAVSARSGQFSGSQVPDKRDILV